jgi:tetratricopeptide (TPR) repeat protein
MGRYVEAEEQLGQASSFHEGKGHPKEIANFLSVTARLYERTDRRDLALEAIEQGIALLQDADDQLQMIELLVQKASLLLADGKTEQAENILYEVLHNAHVQSIPSVNFEANLLSARLLHARGQTKESNHLLKELHNTRGTDAQHAALHYILWQVNGKEEYARVAHELYQKLSRKTPNIEYQERLRELQATLEKYKRVPGKAV